MISVFVLNMDVISSNSSSFTSRSDNDRRKNKPSAFSRYWLHGRRRTIRRKSDKTGKVQLDTHSTELFAVILFTIVLTIMDATFTLFLINQGATEINPLMAFYLEISPRHFFVTKYLLTCTSILILLFLKNANLFKTGFKARTLILLSPIPFYLVVQWQFILMLSN